MEKDLEALTEPKTLRIILAVALMVVAIYLISIIKYVNVAAKIVLIILPAFYFMLKPINDKLKLLLNEITRRNNP